MVPPSLPIRDFKSLRGAIFLAITPPTTTTFLRAMTPVLDLNNLHSRGTWALKYDCSPLFGSLFHYFLKSNDCFKMKPTGKPSCQNTMLIMLDNNHLSTISLVPRIFLSGLKKGAWSNHCVEELADVIPANVLRHP